MPKLSPETQMERETIVRWDDTKDDAYLWTASPTVHRKWERLNYTITTEGGHFWKARIPVRLITLRRNSPRKRAKNPARGQVMPVMST
jgi:hypothetical protein